MKRVISVSAWIFLMLVVFCSQASAGIYVLPSSLKTIEEEAFYQDTALEEVILPDGIQSIGKKAFAGSSVRRIYLPASLKTIASDAFSGCSGVVGYGPAGTKGSAFFTSHDGLTFEEERLSLSKTSWRTVSAVEGYQRDYLILNAEGLGHEVTWTVTGGGLDWAVTGRNQVMLLPQEVTSPKHAVVKAAWGSMQQSCAVDIYDRPVISRDGEAAAHGSILSVNPLVMTDSLSLTVSTSDSAGCSIRVSSMTSEPDFASAEGRTETLLTEGTDYTRSGNQLVFSKSALSGYAGKWIVVSAGAYNGLAQTEIALKIFRPELTVSSVDSATVQVNWNLVPGAQSYELYYNTLFNSMQGGQSVTILPSQAGEGFRIRGSFSTSRLHYWVHAVMEDGSRLDLGYANGPAPGSYKVEVMRVKGLTAARTEPYRITVTWEPVKSAQSYTVFYWETADTSNLKHVKEAGESTSCTVTMLQPETSYSFFVVARGLAGVVGPDSNTLTVQTAPVAALTLGKPENAEFWFSKTYVTSGDLMLNFSFVPKGPEAAYTLFVSETLLLEDAFMSATLGNPFEGTGDYAVSWSYPAEQLGMAENKLYYFWLQAETEDVSLMTGPYSAMAVTAAQGTTEPRIVSVSMPQGTVTTGDSVSFTATAQNATSVRMIIDGKYYGEYAVIDGTAHISLTFHKGGNRSIHLQARTMDQMGEEVDCGSLQVQALEFLEQPKVTVSGSMVTKGQVIASWPFVPNAEEYVVYTYYEGAEAGCFTVKARGTETLRTELPVDGLTRTGNYAVEVIAVAAGYSQRSGGAEFRLGARSSTRVYLREDAVQLFAEDGLTEATVLLNRTAELKRLYTGETAAWIQYTQDGQTGTGWVRAELLDTKPPEAALKMALYWMRTNRYDINCKVTITMIGSREIQKIRVLNGSTVVGEGTNPVPEKGKSDEVRILAVIPPVTSETEFTVQGLDANGKVLKTGGIPVQLPSITASSLPQPEIEECGEIPADTNLKIRWKAVTGAGSYLLTLKKDGKETMPAVTLGANNTEYLIPGSALQDEGSYTLTVKAQKTENGKTVQGAPGTVTLQVTENANSWYLSGKTYLTPKGKYGVLTFLEPFQITWKDYHRMEVAFTDRTGKQIVWTDVRDDELPRSRQKSRPDEAAVLRWPTLEMNGSSASGTKSIAEGNSYEITMETNLAAVSAELYQDGELLAVMSPKTITDYRITWAVPYTVSSGTHTLQGWMIGPDGSRTATETLTITALHYHRARAGTAVLASPLIWTEKGFAATSATCETCGAKLGSGYVGPDIAFPGVLSGCTFTGNMDQTGLSIQTGTDQPLYIAAGKTVKIGQVSVAGDIYVQANATLEASSVSCRNLYLEGTLVCPGTQAGTIYVSSTGRLKMGTGTRVIVQNIEFRSSNDHASLMTGGELVITGDMTVRTPFRPGQGHQTIFTDGRHTLNIGADTYFGILVMQCSPMKLRASGQYRYYAAIFPSCSTSQTPVINQPVLSSSAAPYEADLKAGRYGRIKDDLREKAYANRNKVKFRMGVSEKGNFYTITQTSGGEMLPDSRYLLKVENTAVNALSEYVEFEQKKDWLSSILFSVNIQNYVEYGSYQLNKETVHYQARVDAGIGAGSGGGTLAMFTVRYTEWLDSDPDRHYSGTFMLAPTEKLKRENIDHMIYTMQWEGKDKVDQMVEEAKEEIRNEYISYAAEMTGIEEVSRAWQGYLTVSEVAEAAMSQGEAPEPLIAQYTNQGMLYVTSDSTNPPLVDVTNMTFRMSLENILN